MASLVSSVLSRATTKQRDGKVLYCSPCQMGLARPRAHSPRAHKAFVCFEGLVELSCGDLATKAAAAVVWLNDLRRLVNEAESSKCDMLRPCFVGSASYKMNRCTPLGRFVETMQINFLLPFSPPNRGPSTTCMSQMSQTRMLGASDFRHRQISQRAQRNLATISFSSNFSPSAI